MNDPQAKRPPQPITAIIGKPCANDPPESSCYLLRYFKAGAAPTAHLIAELEKTGITPVHVYGLTCADFFRSRFVFFTNNDSFKQQ